MHINLQAQGETLKNKREPYLYLVKRKLYYLIFIPLIFIAGWGFGYLRFPHLENGRSFGLGFVWALVTVLVIFVLKRLWKKDRQLAKISSEGSPIKKRSQLWMLTSTILLIVGIIFITFISQKRQNMHQELQSYKDKITQLETALLTQRQHNLQPEADYILQSIEEELNASPSRTLSEESINRISTIAERFKPYRLVGNGDSLTANSYSPERGQLLLTLLELEIDSHSFHQIMASTTFAYAYLKGEDLNGVDLSGIDLSYSNLEKVDLNSADLSKANIQWANLKSANLAGANLTECSLKHSNLSWANVQSATLRKADLNSVNLSNASLVGANMMECSVKWANLRGALLSKANLSSGTLYESVLVKTNFEDAILYDVDLRLAAMNSAILTGTNLEHAEIMSNWFTLILDWSVTPVEDLKKQYEVVKDTSRGKAKTTHYLELMGDRPPMN